MYFTLGWILRLEQEKDMHLNKSEILCSADTLVKHVYISSVLHTGANSILLKAEKLLMSKEVPL